MDYVQLKTKELYNLIKNEGLDYICFNKTKIEDELMNYKNVFSKIYKSYWYC